MTTGESGFWDDVIPKVDPERCRRCPDCAPVAACLAGSFRRDGPDAMPHVDQDLCFGCYSCVSACLHGAVTMPRSG